MVVQVCLDALLAHFAEVIPEVFLRVDFRNCSAILHLRLLKWLKLRLFGAHHFRFDHGCHLLYQRFLFWVVDNACQVLTVHQRAGICFVHIRVPERALAGHCALAAALRFLAAILVHRLVVLGGLLKAE